MGIFFIRVDVCDKSVRDRVDDVKNTGKIGVREVGEVGGSLVVVGLFNVDPGNASGYRGFEYPRWFDFWAIKDVSSSLTQFHFGWYVGIVPMLLALGQEIFILTHQDPFPVVIGVRNITSEASKVDH